MERESLDELAHRAISAAQRVSRTLGIGFLEKVYENALAWEILKAGLAVEQQAPIAVTYDGRRVGEYYADVVVENDLIIEVKVSACIAQAHRMQCLNYLRASNRRLGLILNFGNTHLEISRVVHRL